MTSRGQRSSEKTILEMLDQLEEKIGLGEKYQSLFGFSLTANENITDFDNLLDLILTATIDQYKLAETGSIFLTEEDGSKVRLYRKLGLQNDFIQFTEFKIGEGICGIVAQTGKPICIKSCETDPRYVPFRSSVTQLRSILAVPMVSGGEVLGVICIHNSTQEEGFTEKDQNFVEELAKVAAVAIRNSKLYNLTVLESLTDPLTGILNRRGIEASLKEQIEKAKKMKKSLSVLFIDIDGLKHFNDLYSYEHGDRVIRAVTSCIERQKYFRDTVGKWKQGDEFVVILPGINIDTAQVVAERIRKDVEDRTLPGLEEEHFTVSIGVSTLGADTRSYRSLTKNAEEAKNRAKQEGKNKVCLEPSQ